MSAFAEAMRERVRAARAALAEARAAGDSYAAAVAEDELDDALRLALAHGVVTDAAADEEDGQGRS
ncbi:hypothetical protein [Streptomyces griseocarneus]|uniref:hypothetical protein n=1 Tax=Streptomyces griseocarneus TaxID=51201 RepID=UPI00167E91B6|nr:hypothetical protein [Streptomyces griseocarneus]MBZ6474167.1 hypothetical protein [Streptomyces griseocarneus]GHG52383.1 hypothetical protein GCM10018779_13590 [Streptomyces griseocarneus]